MLDKLIETVALLLKRPWPERPYHLTEDEELDRIEPPHNLFGFIFLLFLLAAGLLIAGIIAALI